MVEEREEIGSGGLEEGEDVVVIVVVVTAAMRFGRWSHAVRMDGGGALNLGKGFVGWKILSDYYYSIIITMGVGVIKKLKR